MHDKALLHRLLQPEERDQSVSVRFVDMVEAYYGLQPEINQVSTLSADDLLADDGPSQDCLSALSDLGVSTCVVKVTDLNDVSLRKVSIAPSPSFNIQLGTTTLECTVDTGCTRKQS